jgi:nicotinamide mononucleotide transporter
MNISDLNISLEWLATFLGIAYVILAARHNPWAWPAAFLGAAIYGWLLWQDQLPMQALLHLAYMGMAIWGWQQWQGKSSQQHQGIASMTLKQHSFVLSLGASLTLIIALFLNYYELSQSPWLDTTTSVFALIVTGLVVKQRLENWLYWIVIDITTALLFWQSQHLAMSLLYLVYTALAAYGYWYWRKLYLKQKMSLSSSTLVQNTHPRVANAIITGDKAL